ncbi:type I restriction enzyme HsdR N-terminal domain-containing protein [Capnocytophaga sp. ARDL2]|uniref:type I restriction enzyme HsdR N-terminal domain-containing protein n=1 Tax=Capnocytophaga sp. ARDL2 TaxID=3238809 RepID=UPI003557162B
MQQLAFPTYQFRFKSTENNLYIFDCIRKKFVVLTPEEWVRQHVVRYLIDDKGFRASLLSVEKKLTINGITKRYDLAAFNPDGSVYLLVECKQPQVAITQEVFDQIARYNLQLRAQYLMVTNGLKHIFCQLDFENNRYLFLPDITKNL